MPIAAFTSDGLTAAAAISTSASSSRSRPSGNVVGRGSTACASLAFALSRRTRASILAFVLVLVAMFMRSSRLARARCLRRQAQHFAALGRRRYLPAELLDDVARLLDHLRIRFGKHAFGDLHAIFQPDADVAARQIGQRHAGKSPAPDPERSELRMGG